MNLSSIGFLITLLVGVNVCAAENCNFNLSGRYHVSARVKNSSSVDSGVSESIKIKQVGCSKIKFAITRLEDFGQIVLRLDGTPEKILVRTEKKYVHLFELTATIIPEKPMIEIIVKPVIPWAPIYNSWIFGKGPSGKLDVQYAAYGQFPYYTEGPLHYQAVP